MKKKLQDRNAKIQKKDEGTMDRVPQRIEGAETYGESVQESFLFVPALPGQTKTIFSAPSVPPW